VIISQRVYRTGDGRYVGEGDVDAAFLAYPIGTELSDREVRQLGLEQWAIAGVVARNAAVVIGTDASGRRTMASAGDPLVAPISPAGVPVGTVPAGHATASHPGVPAEVTDPVVNADGTHRGEAPRTAPARTTTTTTTTTGAKPARTTREV
jgi:hypothetical protein